MSAHIATGQLPATEHAQLESIWLVLVLFDYDDKANILASVVRCGVKTHPVTLT